MQALLLSRLSSKLNRRATCGRLLSNIGSKFAFQWHTNQPFPGKSPKVAFHYLAVQTAFAIQAKQQPCLETVALLQASDVIPFQRGAGRGIQLIQCNLQALGQKLGAQLFQPCRWQLSGRGGIRI